jgi:hypothetical protein
MKVDGHTNEREADSVERNSQGRRRAKPDPHGTRLPLSECAFGATVEVSPATKDDPNDADTQDEESSEVHQLITRTTLS